MKPRLSSLLFAALALTAASAAYADVRVSVGINPFGFVAFPPPPVVYAPAPYYYEPPPVVYVGDGSWGGDRGGHWRGRGHDGHDVHDGRGGHDGHDGRDGHDGKRR